ncbi:MAG: flagellar biosynthetic protein FliR [Pseudomonadota bacterium]
MDLFNFGVEQFQSFLLVLVRVGAILMTAPIFGSRNLPMQLKVGLMLLIAAILFPLLRSMEIVFPTHMLSFGLTIAAEVLIGVIIGFSARLLFAGVQLAGQLVGFQMGFAIVNVMDPQTSAQISIIAQFKNIVAILIFLSINAHHWFIQAIVSSFQLVRPGDFTFSPLLMKSILGLANRMFIIAVQVGAPLIAALLFTSVVMGLIARTVPQVNVFIVGFPLKIAVGLIGLGLSLPLFHFFLRGIFNGLWTDISLLLKAM